MKAHWQGIIASLVSVAVAILVAVWNDLRDVKRDMTDVRERIARIEGARNISRAPVTLQERAAAAAYRDGQTMQRLARGLSP